MFQTLPRRGEGSEPALTPPAADEPARPPRPVVGLALGGGAARGFAHIGVLRVLDAAGYDVDVIAGTSIGAVVGGCYIAGKLDQFEEWARSLTKRRVLSLLDFNLGGSGLIAGTKLARSLHDELEGLMIEDLRIPFLAVATEIGPGHEIWLTKGNLVTALRASYALPGIFEPVRINGRWLMDGALVNPVPVSAARALGARAVIAVNLNGELTGRGAVIHAVGAVAEADDPPIPRRRIRGSRALGAATSLVRRRFGFATPPAERRAMRSPGIHTVMMEAFNITQDRISRSRLAGDPPDVSIGPRLGRITPFDFHKAAESIELGADAAVKSLDAIKETLEALA
ncbi:patatin-like phospholipase family protein [Labrys monachus]|uniref:NTE family protein n=1 Tax=Labrys monachus TaxID=217067 RepID=A0ABU0FKU1_9HYPH|nr:patatin-like phospholipase family protein [Labrys monachus]MDQ0395116.1 NTE family protein [Labrys monachus]